LNPEFNLHSILRVDIKHSIFDWCFELLSKLFSCETSHFFDEISHFLEDTPLSIFERSVAPSVGWIDLLQFVLHQELKNLDVTLSGCHVQSSSPIVVRCIQINAWIVLAENLKTFKITHRAKI